MQASPDCSPVRGAPARFLEAAGWDLRQLEEDADVKRRRKYLDYVDGLETKSGKSRWSRVRRCGSLHAAITSSGKLGVAHWYCRDLMCPACMERRCSANASALRAWAENRFKTDEDRARLIMVTLTKPKVGGQSAAKAVDQVLHKAARLFNVQYGTAAALREYITGGDRFLEVTFSGRGQRRADGSKVSFSGFHAHLHVLLEVEPPPLTWRGGTKAWARYVGEMVVRAWLEVEPGAKRGAQHVLSVTWENIGQACKYPMKPWEAKTRSVGREIALALECRRKHQPFGEWRGWKRQGKALLEQEEPRERVFLSCSRFFETFFSAQEGGDNVTMIPFRAKNHERATGSMRRFGKTLTVGDDGMAVYPVPSDQVLEAAKRLPMSIQAQARARREAATEEGVRARAREGPGAGIESAA